MFKNTMNTYQQNTLTILNDSIFIDHLLNIYSIYETGKLDKPLIKKWKSALINYITKQVIPNIPKELHVAPSIIETLSDDTKHEYVNIITHIIKYPNTMQHGGKKNFINYMNYLNIDFGDNINPFDVVLKKKNELNCMGYTVMFVMVVSALELYGIIYMMTDAPGHMYGMSRRTQKQMTDYCDCNKCASNICVSRNRCMISKTETEALQSIVFGLYNWLIEEQKYTYVNAIETYAKQNKIDKWITRMNLVNSISENIILNANEIHSAFITIITHEKFEDQKYNTQKNSFKELFMHLKQQENPDKLICDFLLHMIIYINHGKDSSIFIARSYLKILMAFLRVGNDLLKIAKDTMVRNFCESFTEIIKETIQKLYKQKILQKKILINMKEKLSILKQQISNKLKTYNETHKRKHEYEYSIPRPQKRKKMQSPNSVVKKSQFQMNVIHKMHTQKTPQKSHSRTFSSQKNSYNH